MSSMQKKDHRSAWSVADFEKERPHLTEFVRNNLLPLLNNDECLRVLIRAPVKSGKREMVEYLAVRDYAVHPHRVHAFISAWHRTADEQQRLELTNHNMRVFSMTTIQKAEECITWIQSQISGGKKVVLHVDECDFGAGARQILGRVYTRFRENEMCTFFLYSATPQEVIFSGEIDNKDDEEYEELVEEIRQTGVCVEYTPPDGYCGPAEFLKAGLVYEATPFFNVNEGGSICLSPQGSDIITEFKKNIQKDPSRNIIIIRLSGSDGRNKQNKHIYQFLYGVDKCSDLDGISIIAAKKDSNGRFGRVRLDTIEWSNPDYWVDLVVGRPIIIVIDQTASRSTELVCHNRLFAYHDYRNTVVYTTVSQAQERVNHYSQKYGGFQRIRIYGHIKTFKLSAGMIKYSEYMTNEWIKKKISNQELYQIKNKTTGLIHPIHNEELTLDKANIALQELSSFVQVKVADRVRGGCKTVPVFGCNFIPCTEDSFQQQIQAELARLNLQHNFENPFSSSIEKGTIDGKLQGTIRKECRVWQFNEVYTNRGWGITGNKNTVRASICYNKEQLGVAIRWKTNTREEINTLETFKSMYK
jgi:hypothetical protein